MGSFYTNTTLVGADLDDAINTIDGPALVTADNGCVVVFAERDENHPVGIARELSATLKCPSVRVQIHDDDILCVDVYDAQGDAASVAIPDPMEYFDLGPEIADQIANLPRETLEELGLEPGLATAPPADGPRLVQILGRGDAEAATAALEGDFIMASDRQAALVDALGLSSAAIGWGYNYLVQARESYTGPTLVEIQAR